MKAMIFSCLLFDGGRARVCLDSLDCLIADAPRRVPTFLTVFRRTRHLLLPAEQAANLVVETCPVGACLGIGCALRGGLRLLFKLLERVEHGRTNRLIAVAVGSAHVQVHRG